MQVAEVRMPERTGHRQRLETEDLATQALEAFGHQIGALSCFWNLASLDPFLDEAPLVSQHFSIPHYATESFMSQVAKKPTKKDKLPKKGAIVKGKYMVVKSFGTIRQTPSPCSYKPQTHVLTSTCFYIHVICSRCFVHVLDAAGCFSATIMANTHFLSVRGSRDRGVCVCVCSFYGLWHDR